MIRGAVSANIDPRSAAAERWDVAVIGAGPAGAIAARMCALRGARVLLVDRAEFPRYKVCGGCMNGAALGALRAAGLGRLPEALGAQPLSRVTLASGGRMAMLPMPRGAAVSREALDAELVRGAIGGGARVLLRTSASLLPEVNREARTLELRSSAASQPVTIAARVVIAADGLGGRLLAAEAAFHETVAEGSRIGVGAMLPADVADLARFDAGVIYMSVADGGYVGLARVEQGRFDAAAALDSNFVRERGGIGPAVAMILAKAGHGRLPSLEEARWRGTPALTRTRKPLAASRILAVGDAAGYIEPFTGEGMAWALAGGLAVADVALDGAAAWSPRVAARWEAAHAKLIRRRQTICRALAYVLRREPLRRLSMQLLAPFPQLASPLVARLNAGFARVSGVRQEPVG